MQSFKIVAYLLLGYFWLVEEKKDLLILKASSASAEVSAGAEAKADQYICVCPLTLLDAKEPIQIFL
jgi:hypothetical protein